MSFWFVFRGWGWRVRDGAEEGAVGYLIEIVTIKSLYYILHLFLMEVIGRIDFPFSEQRKGNSVFW